MRSSFDDSSELVSHSRRVERDLVAHIGEVDHRQLYAARASSSMFLYCVEVLHLSEPEAYLRITAGRIARQFPVILEMLRDGRLHLSGIALLSAHLTEENCNQVLSKAMYRTKEQIKELVAELAPKPDAPTVIRKLPSPPSPPPDLLCPERVKTPAFSMPRPQTQPSVSPPPAPPPFTSAAPKPAPLSPDRFKITFTATGDLKDKLPPSPYGLRRGFDEALTKSNERLQALTRKDLVQAIEAAVTEKLERLEAKRYGETKKPRKSLTDTNTSPKSRYVPVAVRRLVFRRDGKQCTFIDKDGRRCSEREGLEFHHDEPYGLGGDHDPQRIRLLCRRHNFNQAERDYGKGVMDRYRKKSGRVSETSPAYGVRILHRVSRFRQLNRETSILDDATVHPVTLPRRKLLYQQPSLPE